MYVQMLDTLDTTATVAVSWGTVEIRRLVACHNDLVVSNRTLSNPIEAVRLSIFPVLAVPWVKIPPMSQADSPPEPDLGTDNYDAMLEKIDIAIENITDKVENGRIRKPEYEKVRIQYYRALGYLIRTRRQILEDRELQEFRDALEAHDDIEL